MRRAGSSWTRSTSASEWRLLLCPSCGHSCPVPRADAGPACLSPCPVPPPSSLVSLGGLQGPQLHFCGSKQRPSPPLCPSLGAPSRGAWVTCRMHGGCPLTPAAGVRGRGLTHLSCHSGDDSAPAPSPAGLGQPAAPPGRPRVPRPQTCSQDVLMAGLGGGRSAHLIRRQCRRSLWEFTAPSGRSWVAGKGCISVPGMGGGVTWGYAFQPRGSTAQEPRGCG